MSAHSRAVAGLLVLTSVISWATPGFALRPVGPVESRERVNLELALRSGEGTSSGQLSPLKAGLEEEPYLVSLPDDYDGPVAIVGKGGGTTIRFQAAVPQGILKDTEVIGPTVLHPGVDTQDQILDRMTDQIARVIDRFGANRVMYVHLSFPGYFDEQMRLTRDQENIPGMKAGLHLGHELEARLASRYPRPETLGPIRVTIVHDGTGGANGERSAFGRHPGAENLFFIAPGTGIATRGIVNGKAFTGGPSVQFLANEAPHTLVFNGDPDNPDYKLVILDTKGDHPDFENMTLHNDQSNPLYGKEDLEDRTSGPRIARYAQQLIQSGQFGGDVVSELQLIAPDNDLSKITTKELGLAVSWNNPLALKAVQDRARELGIGLAVLLVEFHKIWPDVDYPPHIVLGGGVAQIGPVYLNAFKEGFRGRLQRYAQEESGLGLPDVNDFVNRVEPSSIISDSARELLAGLPTPAQAGEHSAKLSAAGLEEITGLGAPPVRHEIDTILPGKFLSGRIPTGGESRLLNLKNIPHPQLVTQWIGVDAVARELIGSGAGLDSVKKREKVDEADLRAQDVQGEVARLHGWLLDHFNFETKGLTPGGLMAGAKTGDPNGVRVATVSDVVEHTTKFIEGKPGASSIQIEGPGAEAFGSFPDEARTLMVVTHINPAREAAVLRRYGAATIESLLDPELPVDQIAYRIAALNGVSIDHLDITLLTSEEADMEALKTIQQTYPGLRIDRITGGTVQPAVAAELGVKDGRVRTFLRRSGMTEAVFNTLLAGVFTADGSISLFRVVSEEIKSGFDNRYVWNTRVMDQMKTLRPNDWMEIQDGKKIFSSRQVKDPMVGAYTFLTPGRTDQQLPFGVSGVQKLTSGDDFYEAHALVFSTNTDQPGKGYLWLSKDIYSYTAAGLEEVPAAKRGFESVSPALVAEFIQRYDAILPVANDLADRKKAIARLVEVSQEISLTDRLEADASGKSVILNLPNTSQAVTAEGIQPTQVLYDRTDGEMYSFTRWGGEPKKSGLIPVFQQRRVIELTPGSEWAQRISDGRIVLLVPGTVKPTGQGESFLPLDASAASAGREEVQQKVSSWLTNWFYRGSGLHLLQDFQNKNQMPAGFSIDNASLQSRLGRLLGGIWGIGRWVDEALLRDLLTGSPDGMKDLRAMEIFVQQIRSLPRKDFFGANLKGVSWSEIPKLSSNRGRDPNQKFRTSLWEAAKPLLRQAVNFTRRSGGYKLSYTPSVVQITDSPMSGATDAYAPGTQITIHEPARLSIAPDTKLPDAGMEEGSSIARLLILGRDRTSAEGIAAAVRLLRPATQVETVLLPAGADRIRKILEDSANIPQAVFVVGTVELTRAPDMAVAVERLEEAGSEVRFISEPDDAQLLELFDDLEEPAGLEEVPTGVKPIDQILSSLGVAPAEYNLYGNHIAKIRADKVLSRLTDRQDGKLVMVTGMTPTPTGEGKTTVSIGLVDGLAANGVTALAALREPSLGPVFGKKGTATGAGRSQLYPGRRINLAFTGDFQAINDANNLLLEAFYNLIYWGKLPQEIAQQVSFNYSVDLNARALRDLTIRVGKGKDQQEQKQGFILTAASEVMAVLALASDHEDLQKRLERIVVAWRPDGTPVTAREVEAVDSMVGLLEYAVMPNLVQTFEGNPALVHAGPFANIAHGTSSVIATRLGQRLVGPAGVVVQETGFGADLGFEKFADVVAQQSGLKPDLAVLVVTVKALKWHAGVKKEAINQPDVEAVRRGLANLDAHVNNIRRFGVPPVVAVNAFPDDRPEELQAVLDHLSAQRTPAAVSTAVVEGSAGSRELARIVAEELAKGQANLQPLYPADAPVEQKLEAVARTYGADGVDFSEQALADIARLRQAGFGLLPPIVVKTPASLSDDPSKLGAPTGWRLAVKGVSVSAGAGFLRVYVGEEPPLLMPGLGKELGSLPPLVGGLEETENRELIEAKAALNSAELLGTAAQREGDSSLADIARLETVSAGNRVSRIASYPQPVVVQGAGLENVPSAAEDLMLGKASLPSAETARVSVGVMAGTLNNARGLAVGAVLSRVRMADGQSVPVAFVVDTQKQKGKLVAMGFSSNSVFVIGDAETPDRDSAAQAAALHLTRVYGVGQIEDLGVNRPVPDLIEQILLNLFGIRLTPESLALWESFIDQATLALQA